MKSLKRWGLSLMLLFSVNQAWASDSLSIFLDDFEDGEAENWTLDKGWSVIAAEGGGYCLDFNSNDSAHVSRAIPIINRQENFVLTLSINFSDKNRFEILLRSTFLVTAIEFQYYSLRFEDDSLFLGKSELIGSSSRQQIIHTQPCPITLNHQYRFDIRVEDSTIVLYLDGVSVLTFTDTDEYYPFGGFALAAMAARVNIDDINVYTGSKGPHNWIKTGGPHGGLGYDVRIHPNNSNIVYVTDAYAGVAKSTDGGDNWLESNQSIQTFGGEGGYPVFCLTIDVKHNPERLWMGTKQVKGVFKSENGGATWSLLSNGISTATELAGDDAPVLFTCRDFAIHPENPDIVLLASELETIADDNRIRSLGVIYKTTDGGKAWRKVFEAPNLFRPIEFNPQNPQVVYAGSGIFDRYSFGHGGMYKSEDGGETWRAINEGLEALAEGLCVNFMEFDPLDTNMIYISCGRDVGFGGNDKGGIFRSLDGGESWQPLVELNSYVGVTTVAPSDPNILYTYYNGNVHKSTDRGQSWCDLGFNCPGFFFGIAIGSAVDPFNPDIVFMNAYNGGVFKSEDGGLTWVCASRGYSGERLSSVYVDPLDPYFIYTMGECGANKSLNAGDDFIGINQGRFFEAYDLIVPSPLDRRIVYAAGNFTKEIFRSDDEGATWQRLTDMVHNDSNTVYVITCIAPDPHDINSVYVSVSRNTINPPNTHFKAIFKSPDRGISWESITASLPVDQLAEYATNSKYSDIAIDTRNNGTIYISIVNNGVFRTVDGGLSWEACNNGLSSLRVAPLEMDPNNPGVIYLGSYDGSGIFKTTNGGQLWIKSSQGLSNKCPAWLSPIGGYQNAFDLESPQPHFLLQIQKNQTPNSRLGGYNRVYDLFGWPWSDIKDIVVDPTNSNNIYAGDNTMGVMRSANGGRTWYRMSEGLKVTMVEDLAISADGRILFAATYGGGVFRYNFGNNAPKIYRTVPSCADTVYADIQDTVQFIAFASDSEHDSLHYHWSLDGMTLADTGTVIAVPIASLDDGTNRLTVTVSDGTENASAEWLIVPTSAIGFSETNKPGFRNILSQNYPNPFNQQTCISWRQSHPGPVTLDLFNDTGQRVRRLIDKQYPAGSHSVLLNASNLPSGIYFYQLRAKSFISVKRMTLIK